MESSIGSLSIESLESQIQDSQQCRDHLKRMFEAAQTNADKASIARQFSKQLRFTHSLRLLLELLEQHQNGPAS